MKSQVHRSNKLFLKRLQFLLIILFFIAVYNTCQVVSDEKNYYDIKFVFENINLSIYSFVWPKNDITLTCTPHHATCILLNAQIMLYNRFSKSETVRIVNIWYINDTGRKWQYFIVKLVEKLVHRANCNPDFQKSQCSVTFLWWRCRQKLHLAASKSVKQCLSLVEWAAHPHEESHYGFPLMTHDVQMLSLEAFWTWQIWSLLKRQQNWISAKIQNLTKKGNRKKTVLSFDENWSKYSACITKHVDTALENNSALY